MLTLPAEMQAALDRGTLDVVHYVKIEKGSDTWEASTRDWRGYPASIDKVGQFSSSLDPMNRKSRIGSMSITSAPDGWLMDIALAENLKGALVTVLWGDMSATGPSQLGAKFLGTCESAIPNAASNVVSMVCKDFLETMLDNEIVGRWLNMHPLEIIEQILTTATADGGLGLDNALIDLTSLDPETHDDIEHWVVSRGTVSDIYKDTSVSSPTSAKQLIDELSMLMDGQLMCREDGLITFVRFKAGTAAVDDWTDDDFIGDPTIDDVDGNARNRITMSFNQLAEAANLHEAREPTTPMALVYRQLNVDAADDIAAPGQTQRIIDEEFTTPWVEGDAIIVENFVDEFDVSVAHPEGVPASLGVGDEFALYRGMLHAFCGTRSPGFGYGLGNFEPDLKLDEDHLGYIRLDEEIIAVDRCVILGRYVLHIMEPAATTLLEQLGSAKTALPGGARFRIAERGCFGTPVQDHPGPDLHYTDYDGYNSPGSIAHDATIPVSFVRAKMKRFAHGAPKITARTAHQKYAYQVGDIVTLTTDKIKYLGHADGIDNEDKWEIVGKQDDIFGDEPCITWTLVWAYEGDGTIDPDDDYATRIGQRDVDSSRERRDLDSSNENVRQPKWNGGEPSHSDTFEIEIDTAILTSNNGGRRLPARTIPVAPSQDTYVFLNERTGTIDTIAVDPGDPAPRLAPGDTRIATVVSDGSDVTSIRDDRNISQPVSADAVTQFANAGIQPNRSFTLRSRG